MSAQRCVETDKPHTEISGTLRCDAGSFPVKKTTVKAMIKNGVIHSPYPDVHVPSSSLFALLAERMLKSGDKAAILYREKPISHIELLQRFRSCAGGMQVLGLGRGDRVYARFCSSSVDGLVALCAAIFTGATVILAGDFTQVEHLASIKSLDITHLLIDSGTADRIIPLLPELKLKGKLSVDQLPGFAWVSSPQWANEASFHDNWVATYEDDVALIAYSSGTSGLPKNIEIPQRCLLYCLVAAEATQPLTSDDICVTGPNICTYIGFTLYLKGLHLGATFLMMEQRQRTMGLTDAIVRHKVTWFMSPPLRALGYARQVLQSGGGPPPSLKSILLAGAPLSAAVAQEVVAALHPDEMRNVYGTTETSGILTLPPPGERCYDNVGFPSPGTRVKVVDAGSGAVMGPMKEGEVLVHSPSTMKGYYNMAAETDAAIDPQGWFHTGDVGFYDEDGRLYLVDRVKFTLDCFGKKVSPCEIEDCLMEHPDVAEAAVLGVPHVDAGVLPAAIVVIRPRCENRGEELAEELKVHVAARLSPWKYLYGGVYFADVIPKTETGKIQRRDLPTLILSLRRVDRGSELPIVT
ncbi:luciferin 4-monooxygenase-like [Dermacentor variabilis]|uniref:luciferin 4-monooxygenase-like n=1 Tax=Dermacentor variabilis TaxID=34621 RepID=UPI003F5C3EF8